MECKSSPKLPSNPETKSTARFNGVIWSETADDSERKKRDREEESGEGAEGGGDMGMWFSHWSSIHTE